MFSCFDSFDCTPSWKMHFHAISRVLFCSGFFHSVNLLPVRPAFWAAFGGEEKCSLGKSTRAPCKNGSTGKGYHENEHPQEKCMHHENLAFLRHRRQFSPLPSLFLDARRFTLSLTYILDQDSIHKLNTNFGL